MEQFKQKNKYYKQPGREMYSAEDIEAIKEIIKEKGFLRIYVGGFIGAGKSTFSEELGEELGYACIDLDKYFKVFREEKKRNPKNSLELLDFVLQKVNPPYVLNYADILYFNLPDYADLVIVLNPKIKELIKSRKVREAMGSDGDWRKIKIEDYPEKIYNGQKLLDQLPGQEIYFNEKTGTRVKVVKKE